MNKLRGLTDDSPLGMIFNNGTPPWYDAGDPYVSMFKIAKLAANLMVGIAADKTKEVARMAKEAADLTSPSGSSSGSSGAAPHTQTWGIPPSRVPPARVPSAHISLSAMDLGPGATRAAVFRFVAVAGRESTAKRHGIPCACWGSRSKRAVNKGSGTCQLVPATMGAAIWNTSSRGVCIRHGRRIAAAQAEFPTMARRLLSSAGAVATPFREMTVFLPDTLNEICCMDANWFSLLPQRSASITAAHTSASCAAFGALRRSAAAHTFL
mmetsp:Transcript_63652/g.186219  ORF Transcript_63652/g.186219 Transcript_63652/m.186219 type:complete len:267 (+) Transcript_63652:163-963(+)